MIISSVKESKLTINTQKIESDTFFFFFSLNPLSNSKQIKPEYNFVFSPIEIQYKSFICYSFDKEECTLFSSDVETMNESIQITIE